jgi:hypothetical protein
VLASTHVRAVTARRKLLETTKHVNLVLAIEANAEVQEIEAKLAEVEQALAKARKG